MSIQTIEDTVKSSPFAVAILKSDGKFINKPTFLKDFLKANYEEIKASNIGYKTIYSESKEKKNERTLYSRDFEGKTVEINR